MHKAASLLALAVIAGAAIVVASAMAQDVPVPQDPAGTDLSATVKATPSKAGTKKNPRGITITATSKITTEEGLEPPIVTGIDLRLGRGFSWNADKYAKCSKRALDRQGLKGCPKESIMGTVIATTRDTDWGSNHNINLFNGSANRLFAYTRFTVPARVEETIVLTTAAMTGKWRYKGTLHVPKSLQVIAGVPIQTTRMELAIGGKPYAKNYITTTSCPKGGWKYQATAHYLYYATGQTGQDTINGTIACKD